MQPFILTLFLTLLSLLPATPAAALDGSCFREDFNTLDGWHPLLFPRITAHSEYSIEADGTNNVLKAVANGSASGLVYRKTFDIRRCPVISWRWKVKNVYAKGDAREKSGDDYPLRIYVLFKYDPGKAGFAQRIKYDLIKSIRGEYPPDSSLNYIWANRQPVGTILANAYTDRAMMLVLQSGSSRVNTWISERVDALADYRRAFGHEPPAEAMLAVMSDGDDTGESATAWLDFIAVGKGDIPPAQ
jgi:Protein of unknown function (DUF3047)